MPGIAWDSEPKSVRLLTAETDGEASGKRLEIPSKLRVLICTGNLGNAMPTPESVAALIPPDGSVDDVLNSPSYPLPPGVEGPTDADGGGKFDIIVMGAQEAVFNAKPKEAPESSQSFLTERSDDGPAADPAVASDGPAGASADSSGRLSQGKSGASFSPIRAIGNAATDALIKPVVTTVVSAAGSCDHTKGQASEMLAPGQTPAAGWVGGTRELYELFSGVIDLAKYESVVRFQRGEMRLLVLVTKELMPSVTNVDVFAENTGIAGIVANKGGIIATLTMADKIRISFLTAHLEAHEGKEHYNNRCANLAEILGGAKSVFNSRFDSSVTSHHMFVCGDLNFRVALPPPEGKKKWEGEAHREEVRAMVGKEDWAALNDADELRGALEKRDCLVGFETLPCHFHPTFKVERQEGFNYQEKRTPSYTDRILWKSAHGLKGSIRPLAYEPVAQFSTSDHKPVRGAFSVAIAGQQSFQAVESSINRRTLFASRGADTGRKLYIFVSDMACTNLPKVKLSNRSNTPYIMFITDPKDLIRLRRSKRQMVLDKLGCGGYGKKFEQKNGASRYREGWPRTRVNKKNGCNPDWGDAEVQLMVRKPGICGPADLEGAMLYMGVYDQLGVTAESDDVLIGTVALNLQELAKEKESGEGGLNQSVVGNAGSGAFDLIDIDEPILKNGIERGRLACSIVAWWVSSDLERNELSKRRSVRRLKKSQKGLRVSGWRLGSRREN